jgi:hypothetical protein
MHHLVGLFVLGSKPGPAAELLGRVETSFCVAKGPCGAAMREPDAL